MNIRNDHKRHLCLMVIKNLTNIKISQISSSVNLDFSLKALPIPYSHAKAPLHLCWTIYEFWQKLFNNSLIACVCKSIGLTKWGNHSSQRKQ